MKRGCSGSPWQGWGRSGPSEFLPPQMFPGPQLGQEELWEEVPLFIQGLGVGSAPKGQPFAHQRQSSPPPPLPGHLLAEPGSPCPGLPHERRRCSRPTAPGDSCPPGPCGDGAALRSNLVSVEGGPPRGPRSSFPQGSPLGCSPWDHFLTENVPPPEGAVHRIQVPFGGPGGVVPEGPASVEQGRARGPHLGSPGGLVVLLRKVDTPNQGIHRHTCSGDK